eukprot:CAMPEP_0197475456 /NCGR_PEP_ID=MMETSP1309-20131121/6907_1 /TAXON_ID=464262 /ORGANISM="Genus nov. species nov., Strain RCC998" /LENGTH=292 /DNA_ID=CAMNT_0043015489 /DNA_START=57 /DNA_END=932 /DNA_ORIENTATION=-
MTQMKEADQPGAAERGVNVCTILNENWEMEQIAPEFKRLDEMLSRSAFGDTDDDVHGMEIEEEEEEKLNSRRRRGGAVGYTLEELLSKVQASESELLDALHERNALQIGDRWMSMSKSYLSSLVDVLVSKVSENKWDYNDLPLARVLSCMEKEDFEKEGTLHCIRVFGSAPMFLGGVNDSSKGSLDETKVCRHYAKQVFETSANTRWKETTFYEQWNAAVPVGMEPSTDMLDGLVLKEAVGGNETELIYYPVDGLPRDPTARFDLLFRERTAWQANQIKHFFSGMTIPPGKQ